MNVRLTIAAVLTLLLIPALSHGQSSSQLKKLLPSAQEINMLHDASSSESSALVRVQSDRSAASGFIISTSRRLVITNAHVADNTRQLDVFCQNNKRHRVARVFIHPLAEKIGAKYASTGVDVALLQLTAGHPLPGECTLAPRFQNQEDIQGQAVGTMSYSVFAYHSSAPNGRHWWRTATGLITSVYPASPLEGPTRKWLLATTTPTMKGGSGSPLFLTNGHVIGVNSGHLGNSADVIHTAVHVDAIWDLLERNRFRIPQSRSSLPQKHAREQETIPQRVTDTLTQAEEEIEKGNPKRAKELLTQVIKEGWRDHRLYDARAKAYRKLHQELHRKGVNAPFEEHARYANERYEDAYTALVLSPLDWTYYIKVGYAMCDVAETHGNAHLAQNAESFADALIETDYLSHEHKGMAYSLKAYAKKAQNLRGGALDFANRGVNLNPDYDYLREIRTMLLID